MPFAKFGLAEGASFQEHCLCELVKASTAERDAGGIETQEVRVRRAPALRAGRVNPAVPFFVGRDFIASGALPGVRLRGCTARPGTCSLASHCSPS